MLAEARDSAESILAEAREKAEAEAEKASREAENCRVQARQEGYETGLSQARREMEEECRKETDAIRETLQK